MVADRALPASAQARASVGGRRIEYAPHACFACGELNEHGLRMQLHAEDGRCWSELELPPRFQGWDGIAHGGIISTILDEVMAWSLVAQDSWGVTARLGIAFARPVPLGRRVRAEGWVVDGRRRVSRTAARLMDAADGTILATADGTYVAATGDRREALKARYQFRLVPGSDGAGA